MRTLDRRAALAVLAGAASVLAFPPWGWWPLGLGALAVLGALTVAQPARRAAWIGYLFGLAQFGAGVYWVYVSCHRYGDMPPVLAAAATALLVAYLAVYPALAVYGARRVAAGRIYLLAALPGAWVLAEGARAVVFTGFPWLSAGYGQVDGPLLGLAPLVGVYGLSLATVLTGGALAALRPTLRAVAITAAVLVAVLGTATVGARVPWTRPTGDPLRVALLQGNVSQLLKWDPEHLGATLRTYDELDRAAAGADLVVWPENAIPAFPQQLDPAFLRTLDARAQAGGRAVLVGLPWWEESTGRYYNAVLALGSARGLYRKDHLVPFGEYVPFKAVLGGLLDILAVPLSDFGRGGPAQDLMVVKGHAVGTSICYEMLFPGEVARALPQAALLVNVSNDAWFGDTIAPHQHLGIARMRAAETGREMVRATNTGITAVIDARGRVRTRAPAFEVTLLAGTVQPYAGATPYVRLGDAPVWLAGAILLGLGAAVGRWRGGRSV